MPRVVKRVARKDYPNEGIKKGDEYYYTKIKLQRGGRVMRSLKPFKQSQLTQSPFKSGWLSISEVWEASDKGADDIRAAAEEIRSLGEEAQGSLDNMPDGLKEGDTGQLLQARADGCEEKASELESLADEMEQLEDPSDGYEEPVEPLGDLETDEENDEAQAAYDDAISEHESAVAEYDAEIERIQGEADDRINDMPEG